ncbi:hypothetical protein [Streptomyces sp. SID3343]|uniref:hypothetical protein n=1 Tax=Streptomyces sp. SID3343 TaxID=2690260 RepID=UPI00136A1FF5|nr:hypothetical protein [Streptomyces sp. SID3343]
MPAEELVAEAEQRRRGRRRLQMAGTAVAVTLCVMGAFATTMVGSDPSDRPAPVAAPSPAEQGSGIEQEPGPFTCGRPIESPVVERLDGFDLLGLTIERTADVDVPPLVSVTLEAPAPMRLNATKVYPTVLLLRDGVVVGGPVRAGALGPGRPLRFVDWDPAYEWPAKIRQPAPDWLCGQLSWQQVWANPSHYTLAVVMTPPKASAGGPLPSNETSSTLLISKVALDDRLSAGS